MALRRRLSTGLPLSDEQMIRFNETSLVLDQAREVFGYSHFGNLAILTPQGGVVDPMALRPRLSTGLRFRFYLAIL
jgi:hypothetical protein